jgi:hypothetical protein
VIGILSWFLVHLFAGSLTFCFFLSVLNDSSVGRIYVNIFDTFL